MGWLWSFGVRNLRSKEYGLYEARDLLLGDHLTEKSTIVYATEKELQTKGPQGAGMDGRAHPDTEDIYFGHSILRDRRIWKMSVSITQWPITIGKVGTMMETGSTPKNHEIFGPLKILVRGDQNLQRNGPTRTEFLFICGELVSPSKQVLSNTMQ